MTADEEKHVVSEEISSAESDVAARALSNEPELPAQDGGKQAWLFLAGAAVIEIVAWGFPYCYGVFREYFFNHGPFKGVEYVSVAGVAANGVLQVSVPFVIYFNNYNPKQRKNTMWLGCLLCVASPIGGAFARTPYQLVICLGPLYGVGAGMLFAPTMSFIAEWFDKRKSLAYGFICGMGGLSGAVLPPIYETCLNNYGHKATLIGWAIAVFILTASGLLFVTSRVPDDNPPKPKWSDFDFLRKPLFWVLLTATIIQGLAHYMPSLYLPSYAIDMGLSSAKGSLLVSLINLAQAIGQPLQGLLADYRGSFYPPMILSTFGSGLETFLIWGFSRKLWSLAIYSFLYGGTAGGYAVLRPRFATGIVGHDKNKEQSLLIFGILTAMRGSAIVASGFISTTLLDEGAKITSCYGAHKWLRIVLYTGIMMVVASLGALAFFIKPTLAFGWNSKESGSIEESMSESQGNLER